MKSDDEYLAKVTNAYPIAKQALEVMKNAGYKTANDWSWIEGYISGVIHAYDTLTSTVPHKPDTQCTSQN